VGPTFCLSWFLTVSFIIFRHWICRAIDENFRSEIKTAKNTGKDYRKGSVDNRTQLDLDPKHGKFVKRDVDNGRFIELKQDDKPFKGVAEEPDGRGEE